MTIEDINGCNEKRKKRNAKRRLRNKYIHRERRERKKAPRKNKIVV
jgi:hypothetical protein